MANFWRHTWGALRLVRLFASILWTGSAYFWDASIRRDARSKSLWLQLAARRCLDSVAVKIESVGQPAKGAVIVSNHMSYIDILVMAATTPVVFVSKKEVRSWPLFGWFAEKSGTRFIDRSKRGDVARIAAEIAPVIADGLTIVIFLEGTTSDGSQVLPFKASLLEPAVSQGWQVVPAALQYEVPAGRSVAQEVCWWGDMTLPGHLWNFASLPWVQARVAWGPPRLATGDRKSLALALHADVVQLRETLKTVKV